MASVLGRLWRRIQGRSFDSSEEARDFLARFQRNYETCPWEPHPLYSVFTQYDQEYYLEQREAFQHKYRCFYAVSKTIAPRSIIELGASAGSSADAYLSAAPGARYLGIDLFNPGARQDDHSPWDPRDVAQRLFRARGFTNYEFRKANLREISALPRTADLVVVDAAHDFANEYGDLKLALTATPSFIFVDDADDEANAKPAIEQFLKKDVKGRIDFAVRIKYIGGGRVIKLKR